VGGGTTRLAIRGITLLGTDERSRQPLLYRRSRRQLYVHPVVFWLRELEEPPVELLPAAPVFQDSRTPGRPVCFSERIVHRESPVRSFLDLRGSSWAYNDPCSLSGYYNVLKKLAEMGEDERFFDRVCCSESHLNSMEMGARGEVALSATR